MNHDLTAQDRLVYAIDDGERWRTDALRVARSHVALLLLARHALSHDRLAVTDEYLDRTIAALTALADRLTV